MLLQLTPVCAAWADATRTLWTCHHIRACTHKKEHSHRPRVAILCFFMSHDNIHDVRVHWGTLPLLFSNPRYFFRSIFFPCIAERARDIVGQLLEIRKRCETLIECRIFTGNKQTKTTQTNKQTNRHKTTQKTIAASEIAK